MSDDRIGTTSPPGVGKPTQQQIDDKIGEWFRSDAKVREKSIGAFLLAAPIWPTAEPPKVDEPYKLTIEELHEMDKYQLDEPKPSNASVNSLLPTDVTKAGLSAYTRNHDGLNVYPEYRHHLMSDAYWAMHNMMIPQQVAEPPATVDDEVVEIQRRHDEADKTFPNAIRAHADRATLLTKLRQRTGSGITPDEWRIWFGRQDPSVFLTPTRFATAVTEFITGKKG